MRTLVLLACLVLTQGRILVKRDAHIPAPRLSEITQVDFQGFQIEWDHVNADIIGYKVKVWELPITHMLHFEVQYGHKVLVDEFSTPKFPSTDEIPENKPRVYMVLARAKPALIVRDIKLDTIYEARVQAFDNAEDGPLSKPKWIKIRS